MTETTTAHTPAAHHDASHEPPQKRHWLLTAGWQLIGGQLRYMLAC